MAEYPNLQALTDGRVSGRISEWPFLKSEAREALKHIAQLEAGIRAHLSGDYPNPRRHRPNKCKHGTNYWEPCVQCDTEHFEKLLDGKESDK